MSNILTITNTALDKLANANISGDSIKIASYSVTDSSIDDEATVGNIIHSNDITDALEDTNNINTIIIKVVIPSSVNSSNTVSKVYLYDDEGDIFAYGLVPPFTLSPNNNVEAELNFYITHSNINSVTLVAPSSALVTMDVLTQEVEEKITNTSIDDLSDVDLTNISPHQFLKWDGNKLIATDGSELNLGIGAGQSVQDFTSVKQMSINYINTKEKTIWVSVTAHPSVTDNLIINVDGVQFFRTYTTAGQSATIVAPVPKGATYSLTATNPVIWTIDNWIEM